MGISYDTHLHSSVSPDAKAPAEEMIAQAESLGLKGICFTDHMDLNGPKSAAAYRFDPSFYLSSMEALREKAGGDFYVGIGMEFGILPELSSTLKALSDHYPFDFIIASQHFVGGMDPYYPAFFEGREERDCYAQFFEEELASLKASDPKSYDSLGHLDYVIRYGPDAKNVYSYEAFADYIDPILRCLIEKGKCLEVNTAGIYRGLGEPNPNAGVLLRYRELGGELITIGSDAHRMEDIAREFDRTADLLKSLGFRYYTVFEKRKGLQIAL